MTRFVPLVVVAATALFAQAAAAQNTKIGDYEYYAGIGGGATKMRGYCDAINSIQGFVGTCDETTTGFKAFAGWKLHRNFGLEAGVANFGDARADGTLNGSPRIGRWQGYGVDLSAIGFLPLGSHFELFAKGGVAFWDIKSTLATTASGEINDRGFSGVLGAGGTWWLMPQVGLRLQYERFQHVGDQNVQVRTNVDFISLNVVGRF
jgi:hypothetical protein